MAEIEVPLKLRALIGLAVVAAAAVAFVVAMQLGGGGGAASSERTQQREIGVARAGAAYGPSRCSSIASKLQRPRITLAEFDRLVWCERSRSHRNASIDQFVSAP